MLHFVHVKLVDVVDGVEDWSIVGWKSTLTLTPCSRRRRRHRRTDQRQCTSSLSVSRTADCRFHVLDGTWRSATCRIRLDQAIGQFGNDWVTSLFDLTFAEPIR